MIKGIYFDGETSDKKEVSLFYTENGRVGIQGVSSESIAFKMLKISPRIGNTARYIEFPNGSQFETEDNDAVDEMLKTFSTKRYHGLAHRLESAKHFILLTVVIVVLFAWGFIQYGVPYLSRELATMLPEEASEYMGKGILEAMDKQWFTESQLSAQKQNDLRQMFNELKDDLGKPNIKLEFRNSETIGANAFALPNGIVVFTDQIINLSGDNNEIMSIMLHEIGHLEHRHSLRAAIQKFSLAMFVMVVTGDVSASSSIITAIPVMLVEAGYSQDMEIEADTFALEYMRANQIDPNYFAIIMEKLEASHTEQFRKCNGDDKSIQECLELAIERKREQSEKNVGVSSYLSTHPATQERIQRFKSN